MLDRNRRIKERPQKFQTYSDEFDVIICLEERVYDQVLFVVVETTFVYTRKISLDNRFLP